MSVVVIQRIDILNNPSSFTGPVSFNVQYQANQALKEDLEWKLIYVGSADSEKFDQVLDSVLVGPIAPGTYKFVFEADAPDPKKIPVDDILGVTVVLLTCSYKDQEFVRVGYYVNNEYLDEELRENPPEIPDIDKLQRNILADKPRVTTFQINFDQENDPQVAPPGFEPTNSQSIRKSDDMDVDSAMQQQHQQIQQQQQQFPQLNNAAQQHQQPFQNGYITQSYEQHDVMEADGTSHQQQHQQSFEVEF